MLIRITDDEKAIVKQLLILFDKSDTKKREKENLQKEIAKLGNIYFCSFADSRFIHALERLLIQAQEMHIFKKIFLFTEYDLDSDFKIRYSTYLKPVVRGFGYWCWKPYVILKCLEEIEDGEILLYLDSGCHLNPRGMKRFVDYWQMVKESTCGLLLSQLSKEHSEYKWSKGDILDYFNVKEDIHILNTPQFQSGIIFIRKTVETLKLIKKWRSVFEENMDLVNDSPSTIPNFPGFKAHRHDQSVLSILAKIHGGQGISISDFYRQSDWEKLYKSYPILIKRDL